MSSEYRAHNFEENFFTRSGLLQTIRQKIADCKIGPRNEKKNWFFYLSHTVFNWQINLIFVY